MHSFFYSFLVINAIFNYVSFGNDVCREFQACRRDGVCIEGNNCACKEGTFGEFCDFKNMDYVNSLEFLRCENREGAAILDCQNEGICIAFDKTQSYCACFNTEFTGDLCQFNRTCEPFCLTPEVSDTGEITCPTGQLQLFEACQDNALPFPSTEIPAVTTIPIVNATVGPLTDVRFIIILVIVNVIFLLFIVAISTSFTCVVFFVVRAVRRKRSRTTFQSGRLDSEIGVPTANGISNANQQRNLPINHYEVPYDYIPRINPVQPVIMQSPPIPPVSTVQTNLPILPYEVPKQTIRMPLPIQRNRFPDTFLVNNRTYSINSNISDLYFQLEEFHDNNESIAPSYAVIVPSASDRESTRNGKARNSYKNKIPPPVPPKPKHSLLTYWEPGKDFPSLFDQMHKSHYKELKTEKLKIFNLVGKGEFGDVWKGTLDTPIGEIPVAIKLLKDTLGKQENISFLQEAAIIGQFNNINVLKLIGVVTLSEPKLIITELMEIQLRDYLLQLKRRPSLPFKEIASIFLGFCRGIAMGMAYLSQKGFIHRDLAARNILLDAQNVCKIADFGMTRRLLDNDYYKMTETAIIPLKWSAPESIFYKKYQSKSDVWSYAIVLFEIWSLGCKPWPYDKLETVISKLNQSILMPPPPGCPREIYLTMVLCWHPEADKRPSFSELCRIFNDTSIDSLQPPPGNGEDTRLGQDLCCSEDLYRDLQYSYRKQTA